MVAGSRIAMPLVLGVALACGGGDAQQTQSTDRAGGEATAPAADEATSSSAAGRPNGGAATADAGATRKRVLILGTSLTAGLGLDPEQAYPTLLQRKADSAGFSVDIVNAGLSGETSAGALRRASWVLDQPAAAIVLEVGANDGLRGVNPDSTRANLMALISAIRSAQPAARVLLVQMEAPTNLGRDYTTRFHDVYARVAKEAGVQLLPFLLDGVAGVPSLNQSDGIHPNVEGSKRVAATMWEALRPAIETMVAESP